MIINFANLGGGGGGEYTLPVATDSRLGGIKVGEGLSINASGVLSAEGGSGSSDVLLPVEELPSDAELGEVRALYVPSGSTEEWVTFNPADEPDVTYFRIGNGEDIFAQFYIYSPSQDRSDWVQVTTEGVSGGWNWEQDGEGIWRPNSDWPEDVQSSYIEYVNGYAEVHISTSVSETSYGDYEKLGTIIIPDEEKLAQYGTIGREDIIFGIANDAGATEPSFIFINRQYPDVEDGTRFADFEWWGSHLTFEAYPSEPFVAVRLRYDYQSEGEEELIETINFDEMTESWTFTWNSSGESGEENGITISPNGDDTYTFSFSNDTMLEDNTYYEGMIYSLGWKEYATTDYVDNKLGDIESLLSNI